MLKSNFYKKKILITGHTGFKGSWLTLWLNKLGANIMGISLDIPSSPSNFNAIKIKKNIIDRRFDLKDIDRLKKEINIFRPNYIFHLAAQSLVKSSYTNPKKTWETNLMGTINLLEVLKNAKFSTSVVIVTSDKCYLNKEKKTGYQEFDELGGLDPYSASKASVEIMVKSYIKSFFNKKKNIRIATARAGNVVGGGDWSKDRLIPDCVKCWAKNKFSIIRNPESVRPWQHVLEALHGYLLLAIALKKNNNFHGQNFNFGPSLNKFYKVKNILKEIKLYWPGIKWKIAKKNSFYESNLLLLNSSKSKKKLGWNCLLNFSDCMKMISSWYVVYYSRRKDILKFSISQIDNYENLLCLKKNG